MNNKAKLIATSGICGAVAVVCLFLAGIPVLKWMALIFAVIASIATVIPIFIDCRNWWYSVIILIVSGALGVFLGIANVVYVVPIVAFCMPFSIVKAYGESVKVTASVENSHVLEDPFNQGDDKQVVAVKLDGKRCLPTWLKWVLYYALLEASLALTLLAIYLFTRPVFDSLVSKNIIYWLLGAAQLVVIPFDLLMRGYFVATLKVMRRAIKS